MKNSDAACLNMEAVAKAAGVHRTTVSLALRGSAKLPEETRERVRAIAEQMGYRPNPLVQALMSARAGRRPRPEGFAAELAYVSKQPMPPEWEKSRTAYAQIFRGAREQAARRGYRLSYWWRDEPRMTARRFARILEARNIHGALIAPHREAGHRLDVSWRKLSVVEIGYNLAGPDFHRVAHDYFHGMKLALARTREAGARRVALVLSRQLDEKVHHLWRAAFVDEQRMWPRGERIAPWIVSEAEAAAPGKVFRGWFSSRRPEVIVAPTPTFVEEAAKAAGVLIPEDVGFVNLSCHQRDGRYSGVFQNWARTGETAVDLLIGMMHRGECGVPELAHSTLLSGLWAQGRTLSATGAGYSRSE